MRKLSDWAIPMVNYKGTDMRFIFNFAFAAILTFGFSMDASGQNDQHYPEELVVLGAEPDELKERSRYLGVVLLCPDDIATLDFCSAVTEVARKKNIPSSWAVSVDQKIEQDSVLLFACGLGGTKEYKLTSVDEALLLRDTLYAVYETLSESEKEHCIHVIPSASERLYKTADLHYRLGKDVQALREE